jgi:hypothetical protein
MPFLVESYVLFADCGHGRLMRGIVHHPPYQVSPAIIEMFDDSLLELNGFQRTNAPPDHAMMSRGVTVNVFPLQAIEE